MQVVWNVMHLIILFKVHQGNKKSVGIYCTFLMNEMVVLKVKHMA